VRVREREANLRLDPGLARLYRQGARIPFFHVLLPFLLQRWHHQSSTGQMELGSARYSVSSPTPCSGLCISFRGSGFFPSHRHCYSKASQVIRVNTANAALTAARAERVLWATDCRFLLRRKTFS
jgi:hypothetical protein